MGYGNTYVNYGSGNMITSAQLNKVEDAWKGRPVVVDTTGAGDFTSINAAIAATPAERVIVVREGVYVEDIVVNKSMVIIGSGRVDLYNLAANNITVTANNVTLKQLMITDIVGGATCIVATGGLTGLHVEDCVIIGDGLASIGMDLSAITFSSVRRCWFESLDTGIITFVAMQTTEFVSCEFATVNMVFNCVTGSSVVIAGCRDISAGLWFLTDYVFVMACSGGDLWLIDYCCVSGSRFTSIGVGRRNKIKGNYTNHIFATLSRNLIIDNIVDGSAFHGIWVDGNHEIICGNIVRNSVNAGIYVGNISQYCVVNGNQLYNNDPAAGFGEIYTLSSWHTINGNVIGGPSATAGINETGGNCVVCGNQTGGKGVIFGPGSIAWENV